MTPSGITVLILVLALTSAVMHATWNALIKTSGDRLVLMSLVMGVGGLAGAAAVPWVGLPEKAHLPWLALSVLSHNVYFLVLVRAYRVGDLSKVYPLARGSAPLLVAAGGWLLVGETIAVGQMAGIALTSLGILVLVGERGGVDQGPALRWALATGVCIAAYSLIDSQGVRAGPRPETYIAWMFLLDCLPLFAITLIRRRGQFLAAARPLIWAGLGGGVIATVGFAMIVWAFSMGATAGIVALRETSVMFGALIGAIVLGEGFGARRILAALLVAAGVVVMTAA